jgi:ribosome-binding factor A
MTIKSERVAELIMAHISQLLLTDVRDPRVVGVTITEVHLDRELEHAEIWVNALGDESREKEVLQGLKAARGFIRKELGTRLKTRRVPELHFKWDKRLEQAAHLDTILNALKDEEKKNQANGE